MIYYKVYYAITSKCILFKMSCACAVTDDARLDFQLLTRATCDDVAAEFFRGSVLLDREFFRDSPLGSVEFLRGSILVDREFFRDSALGSVESLRDSALGSVEFLRDSAVVSAEFLRDSALVDVSMLSDWRLLIRLA